MRPLEIGARELEEALGERGIGARGRIQLRGRIARELARHDRLDAEGVLRSAEQPETVARDQELDHLAAAVGQAFDQPHRAAQDPEAVAARLALDHDRLAGGAVLGDPDAEQGFELGRLPGRLDRPRRQGKSSLHGLISRRLIASRKLRLRPRPENPVGYVGKAPYAGHGRAGSGTLASAPWINGSRSSMPNGFSSSGAGAARGPPRVPRAGGAGW